MVEIRREFLCTVRVYLSQINGFKAPFTLFSRVLRCIVVSIVVDIRLLLQGPICSNGLSRSIYQQTKSM